MGKSDALLAALSSLLPACDSSTLTELLKDGMIEKEFIAYDKQSTPFECLGPINVLFLPPLSGKRVQIGPFCQK